MQDNDYSNNEIDGSERPREPVFNLPPAVIWLAVTLVVIHVIRVFLLSSGANDRLIVALAFIPARYGELASQLPYPLAAFWSPVTYSLLHGGWAHLWLNVLWLAAFGSPLAMRLGTARFALLSIIAAGGGAVLHYAFHAGQMVPVIGASAIVSGHMGAAARFAFQGRSPSGLNIHGPALSLAESLTNSRVLIFLGVWFAINLLFGTGIVAVGTGGAQIAWQAHIGGFLAGILVFSILDRSLPASEQ